MIKEIELAYLAGAIDGDGSFSLIKGTSHSSVSPLYYPLIQFANANEDVTNLFFFAFGGSRNTRASYVGVDGSSRLSSYSWRLEKAPKCLPFLESIIPYLVIKQERAQFLRDYILNNPFVRGSHKIVDSLLMTRERSYIKMRSFNESPCVNGKLLSLSKRETSNDPLFWSYVAGLMDTDGSFSLKKEVRTSGGSKSPVYSPSILLTMTDCRAIYHLMNNFVGGSMFIVKAKTATNGFCYRFNLTSRKSAINFLEKCIPYLFLKKHIAEVLLESCLNFVRSNGRKGIDADELKARELSYVNIKKLNDGVYKPSLIVLKTLTDNAEGNKEQAGDEPCSLNAVSEKAPHCGDAVL